MRKKLIDGETWIVCDVCREKMLLGEKVCHQLTGLVVDDNLLQNGCKQSNIHAPVDQVFNTHVKCLDPLQFTGLTVDMKLIPPNLDWLKQCLTQLDGKQQQNIYEYLHYVLKLHI